MALSGLPGAGKSTYAEYLSTSYGFHAVEGSDCLREVAVSMGRTLRFAADYEQIARELQRTASGSWIADKVLAQGGDKPLHVGLRTRQDFERIQHAGGFVVALVCPPEICRARVNEITPGKFPSPESYAAQIALETSSDGYGSDTLWVIDQADYRINTSRSMEEVRVALDAVIAEQEARII